MSKRRPKVVAFLFAVMFIVIGAGFILSVLKTNAYNSEGLTDHNYQAYTYDFYLSNNTGDEISDKITAA